MSALVTVKQQVITKVINKTVDPLKNSAVERNAQCMLQFLDDLKCHKNVNDFVNNFVHTTVFLFNGKLSKCNLTWIIIDRI